MITGFRFTSDSVDELDLTSIIKSNLASTDTRVQTHNSNIYKSNLANTEVGLFIRYGDLTNGVIQKIQLSMVFFGVRSFSSSQYPQQNIVFIDDFNFYLGQLTETTLTLE